MSSVSISKRNRCIGHNPNGYFSTIKLGKQLGPENVEQNICMKVEMFERALRIKMH